MSDQAAAVAAYGKIKKALHGAPLAAAIAALTWALVRALLQSDGTLDETVEIARRLGDNIGKQLRDDWPSRQKGRRP